MSTKQWKSLSLAIVAATALLLLLGSGLSSTTSEGASITIDGTVGNKWTDHPDTITLNDNDTLTLKASAGNPSGPKLIQIAANANVTINGDPTWLFLNVRISESPGDSLAHSVFLNNLKIAAQGAGPGYVHHKGIINLTGSNEIHTTDYSGIKSDDPGSMLPINSLSSGTLTANGGNSPGIYAHNLTIGGSAKVTATSTSTASTAFGIEMGGPPVLKVEANATLNAGPKGGGISYYYGGTLGIICDGVITLSGNVGILSMGSIDISGSGTIGISSTVKGIYSFFALSIAQTTVNTTCTGSNGIEVGTTASLSNGAKLSTSSNQQAATTGTHFTLAPGTTVTMTEGTAGIGESHTFTMSSPTNVWQLSGDMAFAGSFGPTSSPATIALPSGKTGSVTLVPASPPGITAPAPLTLTEGYAATSTGVFTTTGAPAPNVEMTLGDSRISWNNTTKKLDIGTGLSAGSYPVELKATNGVSPFATVTFTVTVNPSGGGTVTVTSVTVDPSTVSVQKGTTKTFAATVNGSGGTPSQAVTWSVEGKNDANTTITSAGLLTVAAGETATTLTVKATSVADTTKTGTASVTVTVDDPGGDSEEGGGGGNTILWVAIAAVIVVALLGLLFFLFKKP